MKYLAMSETKLVFPVPPRPMVTKVFVMTDLPSSGCAGQTPDHTCPDNVFASSLIAVIAPDADVSSGFPVIPDSDTSRSNGTRAITGKIVLLRKQPDCFLLPFIRDPVCDKRDGPDIRFLCQPADVRCSLKGLQVRIRHGKEDVHVLCRTSTEMLDPGFHVKDDHFFTLDYEVAHQCPDYGVCGAGTPGSHCLHGSHDQEAGTGRGGNRVLADDIVNGEREPEDPE